MSSKILYCLALLFLIQQSINAQDIQKIAKAPPVVLHGNVSAGLNYYSELQGHKNPPSNTSFGNNPAYFLQANPVLSIYGYDIPVNIMISSQNKSFNMPFSRFGMSPSYKWIKLHLGWRSLNFSQFTLSGQQLFGGGFELTPGKFRAAFMYGKFNNAITDISLYNNLNNNIPVYKRKGFAAKIGYGSVSNFIEISYLQAKDDINSISKLITESVLSTPAANQVAGMTGQLTIIKSLSIKADVAASYYINNLNSDILITDNRWTTLAVYTPLTSSRVAVAGETSLNYQLNSGNVNLKYHRVDPNYQSMGAFYMQTDVEQYTVGFNYSFFKNKLHIQSNLGFQKNNLAKTAVNNTKRTIGNIGLNISPSNTFGVDINYSNYGISQQIIPQLNKPTDIIHYDSIRISQVNQSISVAPHLFFNGEKIQHSISLQTNFQLLHNNNDADKNQDFTSSMSSLIYSLIFPKSKFNITNTLNYFNTIMTGNITATIGYNLGITKSFMQQSKPDQQKSLIQSVNISLFGGYFANSLNHISSGKTFTLNPSVGLMLRYKQSLQLIANYTDMINKNSTNLSPKRLMFSLRYNVTF